MESTCLGGEHRLTRQPRVFLDKVCIVAYKKCLYIACVSLSNDVVLSFAEILNITDFARAKNVCQIGIFCMLSVLHFI